VRAFRKTGGRVSRYHKYTLGTELRAGSRAVLMQVLRANQAGDAPARSAELLVLRDHIDALLLSVRLAKEVKAFNSFTGYLHVVEQVGSVARQNEGWFKSTQQRCAPAGRARPGERSAPAAPGMGA